MERRRKERSTESRHFALSAEVCDSATPLFWRVFLSQGTLQCDKLSWSLAQPHSWSSSKNKSSGFDPWNCRAGRISISVHTVGNKSHISGKKKWVSSRDQEIGRLPAYYVWNPGFAPKYHIDWAFWGLPILWTQHSNTIGINRIKTSRSSSTIQQVWGQLEPHEALLWAGVTTIWKWEGHKCQSLFSELWSPLLLIFA